MIEQKGDDPEVGRFRGHCWVPSGFSLSGPFPFTSLFGPKRIAVPALVFDLRQNAADRRETAEL